MSVYSKRTSKSRRSSRTNKTNQTHRSRNSIRPKLIKEIKTKHGVTNSNPWHIELSLLECMEKPNPFNKLISSHDNLSNDMQSSVCCTLSTCLEIIIDKKQSKLINNDDNNDNDDDDDNDDNDMMDTEIETVIMVTSTELFAVFMTLLENKNNEQHEISIIILLSYLIESIPINVLLNQFDNLSQKIGSCFTKNVSNQIGVEYSINCMSSMLIQRISNGDNIKLWNNSFCQKMVQGLFVLAADDTDKIRKLSLKHIKKIFKLYSTTNNLPKIIKNLMRYFIERQIEGLLNNDNENKTDLNVIAFICELLMETLQYLTLKESSYIISLLFNVISYSMQTYGDNLFQFKNLNLQQMFLKLICKFIKSLPIKFNNKSQIKIQENNNNDSNIDELANQLKDKIDLKKLVNEMKLDDIDNNNDDNDNDNDKKDKYIRFMVQLFDVIQKLKPQSTDTVGIPIYYNCLISIIEVLYEFDNDEALSRCISIISIILDGFESNKKKIVEKASESIVKILEIIVNDELILSTKLIINDIGNNTPSSLPPLFETASTPSTPRHKLPILQRIVILIEGLLDFKYKSSWIYVYSLCSNLFRLFGDSGFFLLCNILSELSELRCIPEPIYKSYLEDAISSSIKYCGPENALKIIPLNLPTSDVLQLITMDKAILKANLWLLPLLKNNVNRTNLSFFGMKLLPIADMMMKQSKYSKEKNMIIHSKQFDNMAHLIWQIFPAFCIYPSDFNITFPKITESISFYLINIHPVRPYIIAGFIHLIKKPVYFIKKQNEKGIFGNDMINNAKLQIECIANYTENYLKILCNILIQTDNDKRLNILKLIGLFAEIGDQQYIISHFTRTMVKCLEDDANLLILRKKIMDKYNNYDDDDEDEEDDNNMNNDDNDDDDDKKKEDEDKKEELEEIKIKYEKILNQETAYLLILNEMIEFVDISEIEKFWHFLKQQFMKTDQSPLIQKLLYRNLFGILNYRDCLLMKDHKQLMNFTKFVILLNDNSTHKQLCIGAKYQRLNCIHTLLDCLAEYEISNNNDIDAFIQDNDDNDDNDDDNKDKVIDIDKMKENTESFINIYPEFIGELVSNVSLSNLKIRKSSLQIIELIAMRLDDISSILFNKFILKLLGGLLSTTSSMQSATILCLTYLMVQFEMRVPPQILNELLKTISLRIEDPANNVIKSSLDFIQIVIQEMPDGILENNLMDLLTTLLKWINDETKTKFKCKINKCIDLLLKRFGYEKIIKLVPHRFQRLIKYLRKRADYIINKREKRKQLQRDEKLKEKQFNKKLDDLPPDHPLNIGGNDGDDDESDDDGKLTVFEQMKTERMSRKSSKRGGRMSDITSVRMRIDGDNDITDLSSKTSVKKHLISEYEANRLLTKQQKINELGIESNIGRDKKIKNNKNNKYNKKNKDHIYELNDGRLLITDSDSDDDQKGRRKWKNLSDDDNDNNDDKSDSDLSDNYNDDRDVDDILSQYSKCNKMTQLKKALADVSKKGKGIKNKRLYGKNDDVVIGKRRRILDSVQNDSWIPGELQPYKYHIISPALLSRKKKHLRQSTFQKVMGRRRNVTVRTDSFHTNYLKISRTRKVGHGRYTLKRSKIKAKQKHLMQDIVNKHRENQFRQRSRSKSKRRSKSRSKSKNKGRKRRLGEM